MKCSIEYVGKARNGKCKYYCTVHKSFAHDKQGNKLEECLWTNKEIFDNHLKISDKEIKDIKVIYENILENVVPKIIIDDKEFNGVLGYDNSLLSYKDFSGILLAKINNIPLENVKCNHCGKPHSDNGMFAYTPHSMHLCLYCGHLFRVKNKNVGSELNFIYDIPDIKLKTGVVDIENGCSIEYDLFKGGLLINNNYGNQVLLNKRKVEIQEFLNKILENEF